MSPSIFIYLFRLKLLRVEINITAIMPLLHPVTASLVYIDFSDFNN